MTFSSPTDPSLGYSSVGIYEYAGINKSIPIDNQAVAPSAPQQGSILNGVLLNTSEDNEICFAVGVDSGLDDKIDPLIDSPVTPGDGYTLRDSQHHSVTGERLYTEDANGIKQAASGCKPNFTLAYDAYWSIIGIALKP